MILDVGSRIPSWPAATAAAVLDTAEVQTAVAASSERQEKRKVNLLSLVFITNDFASVLKCSFEEL